MSLTGSDVHRYFLVEPDSKTSQLLDTMEKAGAETCSALQLIKREEHMVSALRVVLNDTLVGFALTPSTNFMNEKFQPEVHHNTIANMAEIVLNKIFQASQTTAPPFIRPFVCLQFEEHGVNFDPSRLTPSSARAFKRFDDLQGVLMHGLTLAQQIKVSQDGFETLSTSPDNSVLEIDGVSFTPAARKTDSGWFIRVPPYVGACGNDWEPPNSRLLDRTELSNLALGNFNLLRSEYATALAAIGRLKEFAITRPGLTL